MSSHVGDRNSLIGIAYLYKRKHQTAVDNCDLTFFIPSQL